MNTKAVQQAQFSAANPSSLDPQTAEFIRKALSKGRCSDQTAQLIAHHFGLVKGANPKLELRWEENFKLLNQFTSQHERLPQRRNPGEQQLSVWVRTQLDLLGQGKLTEKRKTSLFSNPVFAQRASQAPRTVRTWEERCQQAVEFVTTHGCRPASTSDDDEEASLAKWLAAQRRDIDSLPPERRRALEAIPHLHADRGAKWSQQCEQLIAFTKEQHRLPQSNNGEAEYALYTWFTSQRTLYANGRMSNDRVEALKSSPVAWEAMLVSKATRKRASKHQDVADFVEQSGRWPSVKASTDDECKLAQWVLRQSAVASVEALKQISGYQDHLNRELLRKTGRLALEKLASEPVANVLEFVDALPPSRASELAAARQAQRHSRKVTAPVAKAKAVTADLTEKWAAKAEELRSFTSQTGRMPTQNPTDSAERSLHKWFGRQATGLKKGELSDEQIELLKSISVVADYLERKMTWEDHVVSIHAFATVKDRAPKQESKDQRERIMGLWLSRQVTANNQGKLSEARLAKLRSAHTVIAERFAA